MPRVTNTGEAVKLWAEKTGERPTFWDVHAECRHDLSLLEVSDPQARNPEPLEDWEEGAEHPSYDNEGYFCGVCDKLLTSEDD